MLPDNYIVMGRFKLFNILLPILFMLNAVNSEEKSEVEIFETAANGNKLTAVKTSAQEESSITITLFPDEKFQTITGFGGSFTEASASLLNKLSKENRNKILEAYFGDTGARYSLT